MTYIFMDCEMGGRELKYSLLTAYFLVTDSHFKKIGDLNLYLKPDDGDYIVSGQGMSVNKIDLVRHDDLAATYKMGKSLLYSFLTKMTKNIKGRLTPVGHGVKGDIEHVIDKLISRGSWEQFCTYHYIDTSVVLQFLRACGKMDEDCEGSIGGMGKHFGIINEEYPHMFSAPNAMAESNLHDAKFDTEVTAKIFAKFVELGSDAKVKFSPLKKGWETETDWQHTGG